MSLSEQHTCVTCKVYFKSNEIQRDHYKSDWHRYNLKRKIVSLPSVTAEEFNNRVLQQRSFIEKSSESLSKYCETCKKSFGNDKSYENHLNSNKHLNNVTRPKEKSVTPKKEVEIEDLEEDLSSSDVEELDSDEWEDDTPVTECLFCNHHSRSLVRNLRHMTEKHSFFIPDLEFCIDLEGLIRYLGAKIRQGNMCIWCSESGKSFQNLDSVQNHMIDKGHCKVLFEGAALVEYTDFYDYTSSYPDPTDSNPNPDEEVTIPEIDGSDYNLVLPSGAVIGHRSLFKYYKQRFTSKDVVPVQENKSRPEKIFKILAHYRNTGWEVAQPEQVKKRARDVQYVQKLQRKWEMKLSLKANKLQKHFRQQVNF